MRLARARRDSGDEGWRHRCGDLRRRSGRPRCPLHDRRLVRHDVDADEAGGADPVFHRRAQESSQRAPQHSHRRGLVRPGGARGFDVRHLHDGRRPGAVSALPRLRQLDAGPRPDVPLERRRDRQLHRQPGGRARLHHAARRHAVAASGTNSAPSRVLSVPTVLRRPLGTPAFCVPAPTWPSSFSATPTIARRPHSPTSIRSTTGRTI